MGIVKSSAIEFETSVIPINALATGTPDGTKFIRDDGTLAVPAGTGITALTTDVVASGAGSVTATIQPGVVTLTKQANLAANSIIGNNTGSPATPLALTAAQVKTLLAIAAGDVSGLGTLATQSGTFSGTSSGTNTGDQSLFSTIAVSGQSNVVADAASDTLTLVAGTNITITTDAGTDSVTIAASGGSGNTLYAPGSVTVATGNFALHVKNLTLTTTQRLTLAGTARFRLSN